MKGVAIEFTMIETAKCTVHRSTSQRTCNESVADKATSEKHPEASALEHEHAKNGERLQQHANLCTFVLNDTSTELSHLRATIRRVSTACFQYEEEENVGNERGSRIDPVVVDV